LAVLFIGIGAGLILPHSFLFQYLFWAMKVQFLEYEGIIGHHPIDILELRADPERSESC
jgi:hypothetical protein